ncbi:uncharacterized protein [Clytia hemisphaerica]|uniref:uncharacterized protein n=1 Tax=Clytia hemisphaerica TaxID=252671 RepID=UPI0034D63ACB
MEEFNVAETALQKSSKKRRAKRRQLKRIGGKDTRTAVRLALDAMMSKGLQSKFSKEGTSKMRKFIDTEHYNCLADALMMDDKHKKVDIDTQLGDVIKRAKDDEQVERGKKKKKKKHNDGACGHDNPEESDNN